MITHDVGFIAGMKLEIANRSLGDGFVVILENQKPDILPAIGSLIAAAGAGLVLILVTRYPALLSPAPIPPLPPAPAGPATPPLLPKRDERP